MSDAIRVIHVDDDPDLLEVASIFIEEAGDELDVETTIKPTAVADRLRENGKAIDCIVSDYDMPHMDGLELLNIVRNEHPKLPFILYTGKGSEEIASDAISLGVTDYMQKETGTEQYEVLANRIENSAHRKQVEQELRRRESIFRKVSEQEIVGIYIIQDEQFTYINQKFADIFGYERNEITNMSPYNLVAPSDRETVKQQIRHRLRGASESVHHRFSGLHRDGSTIPIESHGGRTMFDSEPAIVGVLLQRSS